jgi:hypothetical protein
VDSEAGQDLVKERNYRDMIINHVRSGQYQTEDINRVPYTSYNDHTF